MVMTAKDNAILERVKIIFRSDVIQKYPSPTWLKIILKNYIIISAQHKFWTDQYNWKIYKQNIQPFFVYFCMLSWKKRGFTERNVIINFILMRVRNPNIINFSHIVLAWFQKSYKYIYFTITASRALGHVNRVIHLITNTSYCIWMF